MHGFVLFAVAFSLRGHNVLATISMVLAINFKQTALYFALPFVVFTISRLSLKHHHPNIAIEIDAVIWRCIGLGIVFVLSNAIIWAPWLITPDFKFSLENATTVFKRIFPVRRGIFEDKVATFWCVIHYCTPLKPNNWFDREFQFKMTMGTTFLSCLPACWFMWKAPT